TMVSNAQATTKGAIILLTNFVFISVIFFHCFGLPWLPTVGGHFWPFISSSLQIAPKKFQEILASNRITTSKQPALACGKRLATGAVALQHEAMKKAYARAG